jgi:hypothetical protein
MQQTILSDTDEYIAAFLILRQALAPHDSSLAEPSEDVSPE